MSDTSKSQKIKLGIATGALAVSAVLIYLQFAPAGGTPQSAMPAPLSEGAVLDKKTGKPVYRRTNAAGVPQDENTRGGAQVAPGG
ncbi:MAG: hypothetical protein IT435_03560 [Phycisphaerales bacterium]|nr:hypothetical protein [Phycisphaerales bacterium]